MLFNKQDDVKCKSAVGSNYKLGMAEPEPRPESVGVVFVKGCAHLCHVPVISHIKGG